MTDAQRAKVWEALDRVRFFRVVESPSGVPCHLVATEHFEEDPRGIGHYGDYSYVGCTPTILARNTEAAAALCHELFVERLAREGSYIGNVSVPSLWERPDVDPFANDDDNAAILESWAVYLHDGIESRPLELLADRPVRPGQEVFVVVRRHWRLEFTAFGFWRWALTHAKSCGRPIAAFKTLAGADECMAKLEADARRTPALFRFGPPQEWSVIPPPTVYGMLSEIAPVNFTNLWENYQAADHLWCHWWDEFAPTMTPEQIETVWAMYDKLKFYEVVAVEYRE
jgi:hypothetical protein